MRQFNWHIATKRNGQGLAAPSTAIMEPSPTLEFTLDYPLTRPFRFSETHEDGSGWTEVQFCDALHRAYVEVYAAEGPDPGNVPGMLNRATTDGPYGIVGHRIDDLWLEQASKEDGEWTLFIGS